MIRIAVAEDQEAERERLLRYLKRYQHDRKCTFEVEIYPNGAELISAYQPGVDILLLDIEMPVMDGMQTAKILREKDKKVVIVFITNLAQYAIQGYEVQALDFIVKPMNWDIFSFRMDRIISRLEKRLQGAALTLSIRTDSGPLKRIDVTDLLYVEVNHHTLTYHAVSETFTARGTMRETEEILLPQGFCRCNQCYLINLRYVTGVDNETVFVGNEQLHISRGKKKDLVKALSEFVART